jgi:hypothetical protein
MIIDNAALLNRLFTFSPNPWAGTTPYLKFTSSGIRLFVQCHDADSMKLFLSQEKTARKLVLQTLGYELCLETAAKLDKSKRGNIDMATVTYSTENKIGTQGRLFKLEALVKITGLSIEDIKIILAKSGGAIYPREDGSEMVCENFFDLVILNWAKSLKGDTTELIERQSPDKPRKQGVRVLKSELTIDDLMKHKGGKLSGSPNLSDKGLEQTLTNFFNKVKLDDSTLVDAISAFIEGSGEFGQALRKKIATAYRKFFPGANASEIEAKLVNGAKTYLENLMKQTVTAPLSTPEDHEPEESTMANEE